MTSGYTILHLQDKNFVNGVGQTVPGAYEQIEGTRKPILLEGFSYDGVERPARFTVFGNDGGTFVSDPTIGAGVVLLRCNVTAADLVTFTEE